MNRPHAHKAGKGITNFSKAYYKYVRTGASKKLPSKAYDPELDNMIDVLKFKRTEVLNTDAMLG